MKVESVLEVALKKMIFELDLKQLVGIVILEHEKVLKKKRGRGGGKWWISQGYTEILSERKE